MVILGISHRLPLRVTPLRHIYEFEYVHNREGHYWRGSLGNVLRGALHPRCGSSVVQARPLHVGLDFTVWPGKYWGTDHRRSIDYQRYTVQTL
jgi:hypothetical protein